MILKANSLTQPIYLTPSAIPNASKLASVVSSFKKRVEKNIGTFEAMQCLISDLRSLGVKPIIDTVTFENETTKEVLTYTVENVVEQNYYYIVYLVLALVENESYLMKAFSDGNEVFKTIVFCTNQNPADFSINNNRYTQRASNNQYKVYE